MISTWAPSRTALPPPHRGDNTPRNGPSHSRPPSYTSGAGPPSFVSSPPRSVFGDGDNHSTLANSGKDRKGKIEKPRDKPALRPIIEEIVPPSEGKHHNGYKWTVIFTIVIACVIIIMGTVTPVLLHFSKAPPVPAVCYTGGFASIGNTNGQVLYYANTQGTVSQAEMGYVRPDWPQSQSLGPAYVKPDSPVQAFYLMTSLPDYLNIHILYVNLNNTIQGQVASETGIKPSSINNLNLQVSDSLFMRICVVDDVSYQYSGAAYPAFLYFTSSNGSLKKYAYNDTMDSWLDLGPVYPPVVTHGEIECQFDSGIESLWSISTTGVLEQWWRQTYWFNVNSTSWNLGIQGTDKVFPNTSILSFTAGASDPNGRSHIFFQDTDLYLHRYDITGRGENASIISSSQHLTVTPGSRLSTWAPANYCGEAVDVFYQRGDTSDIHYLTFKDNYFTITNKYEVDVVKDDVLYLKNVTCGEPIRVSIDGRVWKGVGAALGVAFVLFLVGLGRVLFLARERRQSKRQGIGFPPGYVRVMDRKKAEFSRNSRPSMGVKPMGAEMDIIRGDVI